MSWHITSHSVKGPGRSTNQDRVVIDEVHPGVIVAAVFDGHGRTTDAADFCAKNVARYLSVIQERAARESLLSTFKLLARETESYQDGTTASIACLFDSGKVAAAVLGDSLIMLKSRGRIIESPHHNVLSRAFGYADLNGMLSTTPDILEYALAVGDWLVVMSDGVVDPSMPSRGKDRAELVRRVEDGGKASDLTSILRASKRDDASAIVCRYYPDAHVPVPKPAYLAAGLALPLPIAA
jgi:serine/threonine protein phosphatase PrpC